MQVFKNKEKLGIFTKTGNTTGQYSSSVLTLGAKQYSSGNLVLDTSISGAGGIDTGSIAANTLYYVYAIVDAGAVKLIASTNEQKPSGYSVQIKVGAFETDGSSNIRNGYKIGDSVDTHWQNLTGHTFNWGGSFTVATFRRKGDSIDLNIEYITDATNTGSTPVFTLPPDLVIDVSKYGSDGSKAYDCLASARDISAGLWDLFGVYNTNGWGFYRDSGVGGELFNVTSTTPFTWANDDRFYLKVNSLPILGFASNLNWTQY